jgi:hypothetical protein
MKIVLFWYNKYQKDFFWSNKDYIFFDDLGWWIFKDGDRKNFKINYFVKGNFSNTNFDFLKAIKKIKSSSSMWNRHNSRGDTYERIIRTAAINTFYIYETLNYFSKKKINIAFFDTSVSHHLDTEICDIASTQAGWEKYYFYFNVLSGRLIPLKVGSNISKRQITNIKFSKFRYDKPINNFVENLNINNKPKYNSQFNIYNKIFVFALFKVIFFYQIKNFLLFFLDILHIKKKKNIFNFTYNKFPFQDLIQIFEQRIAINFFLKNTKKINFLKKDIPLIILASYQPEATTTPEGYNYENYIELVFNIRKLGFTGKIYFKEHDGTFLYTWFNSVTQVSNFRSRDFYKQLKSFDCSFISTEDYEKIKYNKKFQSIIVAINGTVAFERSLNGYHTVIAGSTWFKKMPGIINFSDIKDLKSIPLSLVKKNNNLAIKSKKYLLKKLNRSTLVNISNIGIGEKDSPFDNSLVNTYKIELTNFIKYLKIKK